MFNLDKEINRKNKESKYIFYLNEDTKNDVKFLGFFQFYIYHYIACIRKNKRNSKIHAIENFLKNYINGKFEVIKYFKKYYHYKYLKNIILSTEQNATLKNISNFKIDFKLICKPSKKKFHDQVNRDFYKKALVSKNDIIDERIKDFIDSLYLKN